MAVLRGEVRLAFISFFLLPALTGCVEKSNFYLQVPLHSTIEAVGAWMAIVAAVFLLNRGRDFILESAPIAMGFLWMGILDLFHASTAPGDTMVLLHNSATLAGALGFSVAWLPKPRIQRRFFWTRLFPFVLASIAVAVGLFELARPETFPQTIREGEFTSFSYGIHYVAAALFLAAGARYFFPIGKSAQFEKALFGSIAILFGTAALLFSRSTIWTSSWWLWHVVRLGGYTAIFWLLYRERQSVFSNLRRSKAELLHLNSELEGRVRERTSELETKLQQHRLAEDSLKRSQESLTRAQAMGMMGNWERDLVTNRVSWSDEMRRLVGLGPVDPMHDYENFLAVVHPDDRKHVEMAAAEAVRAGKICSWDYRLLRKDGEVRHIHVRADVVRDSNGKPLRLAGTAQDVTERVRAEAAIKESEAKFRLLLDSTAEGLFGSDLNGRCTFINHAGLELLRYKDASEVIGKDVHQLMHHTRADGTPYPKSECKGLGILTQGKRINIDDEVFWRADGTCFCAEYWTRPIFQEDKLVGGVTSFTDITERKRLESDLRAAIDVRDDFMSIASHELKTPLTALGMQLELLRRLESQDAKATDGKLASLAETMRRGAFSSVQQITSLVDDLLDVTRIRVGKLNLHKEETDLRAVILENVAQLEEEAKAKGSSISIHLENRVLGHWDPHRMGQIVSNLLSNAIKYGAGNPIEIRCFADPAKRTAQIIVKDAGEGISEEMQPKIFERFQRAVSSDRITGLGLGLYIVRQIVEAHGGTISVESTLGQGSLFQVQLPMRHESKAALQKESGAAVAAL